MSSGNVHEMAKGAFAGIPQHYEVHPESISCVELLIQKGARPFSTYTLDEARKVFLELCIAAGGDVAFDGQIQELTVPSPHAKAGIPVTVYKPSKVAATPAIVIYFHGGGLVLFERKCFDACHKKLAMSSGSIIVNVEYRRLPDECKGHGPFDDGVTVAKWVKENKKAVGGQPGSKVGVAGDSSGGQLAISVTNDVPVDFLIAVYPHADTSLSKPSVKEFCKIPILTGEDLDWFVNLVSKDLPNQDKDPRVNALARTNLKSAPPSLIIVAELDTLRDSGITFGEHLKAAGVKVKLVLIKGVTHIFFGMCKVFPTKCAEAYGHVTEFLKEFQ